MKEPKIRLKGFSGEWEEMYLLNLATSISSGKDSPTKGRFPLYGSTGVIGTVNTPSHNGPLLLVARVGANAGHLQLVYDKCGITDNTLVVSPKTDTPLDYLYYHFQHTNLNRLVYGSGQPLITGGMLKQVVVCMGCNDERNAITSYFQHLDSLIQSTTKKIESLKQVKVASLQSMFPQEGETVPRVRFKGFEGEWEKLSFCEVFSFIKNNSFSRDQLSDCDGEIKNVHYGDVLIKFGDIIDMDIDSLPYIIGMKRNNKLCQMSLLQDGDIIIADAAEDNTVGKCSEIINVKDAYVISGLHTIACRPKKKFALGYLGHYINTDSYHNQLLPLIQGSKISSISKSSIKQTGIVFPSFDEQQVIASYFTNLDNQISLQTKRLDKLKQIKSACLDNMFV